MKTKSATTIVWGIDPFEGDRELLGRTAQAIRGLFPPIHFSIQPVYVLSPDQLNLPSSPRFASVANYRPSAEKALSSLVKKLRIPTLPPKVILQERPFLSRNADALDSYAKSLGAALIVVGTHARKGLPRAFLGSFAETLIQHSGVPVVTINPSFRSGAKRPSILFASDLSDESHAAFRKALDLAVRLKAELTLLHAQPSPLEPVLQSGVFLAGGGWIAFPDFMKKEEEVARKTAKLWEEEAARKGMQIELVIDRGSGSVFESIMKVSKKRKPSLIALASQSGVIGATLLGSISRQVARNASCPVWIFNSKIEHHHEVLTELEHGRVVL